jgi:hypothetical protein
MKLRLAAWAAAATLAAGCTTDARHHAEAPDISGRWIDEYCQFRPSQYEIKNIYVRREFTFEQRSGAWGVDARFYADPGCALRPVFTLIVRGSYEITAPSAGLPGVFDGRFAFSRRVVIPYSEDALRLFARDGCGGATVAAGRELDVSRTGCPPALSKPITPADPAEYDLVKYDGKRLAFGVRTPQMTRPEGRPKQPSPFGLVRW